MIISASTDYRAAAQRKLPPFLFHYIDGGAYAEYTLRRNVEDLAGMRAFRIDPVQEKVRRPAIWVGRRPAMAVRDAAIGDGIADRHRQRRHRLDAPILGDDLFRSALALPPDLERPGHVVAIVERQRQAVLARRAVAVDAAEEAATAARLIEPRKMVLNMDNPIDDAGPCSGPMGLSLGDARHRACARTRPDLSSCGFTPVRPAHPVRAKDDGDGQVSWLAGQRRPAAFSGPKSQWRLADGSPRTVAGAAGVFPFPLRPRRRGTCRLPRPIARFGGGGQSPSGACFSSPPRRRGPPPAMRKVTSGPRLRGGDDQTNDDRGQPRLHTAFTAAITRGVSTSAAFSRLAA